MGRASPVAMLSILLLSVLGALGFAVTPPTWRSDATLSSHFRKHRAEFEQLVKMAMEDARLTRIAPDFRYPYDDVGSASNNIGLPEPRRDEYRRLFGRVGASLGIWKDIDPSRIFFPIVSAGLVAAGWTKGLVYSTAPLSPVLKSLDERPPDQFWERSHVLVYRKIEDHWYIYYEQW